ncbi:MAG: phosphoglycerate kinase, partial [Pseudomonadota bacterium]|nr:phosphoglycerate kinase [Pseudomonadota bacterium]
MNPKTLNDYELKSKKVLVRADLNVPMDKGKISDTSRIERLVPTIRKILESGGKPILLSHFGRPNGSYDEALSLKPLIPIMNKVLGFPVKFSEDVIGAEALESANTLEDGEVLLMENTRFYHQEEANELSFSKSLSELGDIFCNDAFSASHRAHASTVGVAQFLPNCMGLLMQEELTTLKTVLTNPEKPVIAVVGGAKVSSKLDLLINLIHKVDHLVIGGGMANTFLYAQGNTVGKSLCERNMKETALKILKDAVDGGCHIHIPNDAVIASDFKANAKSSVIDIGKVPDDALILDIGPSTCNRIDEIFHECRTLIWNGPMGAFEVPPFD